MAQKTVTKLLNLANEADYNYDSDKIEFISNYAKLKLQQGDVDFTEDFDNDTDFVYDSNKAEFTAGQVQQKDTRPADASFYASLSVDENASWGDGSLNGSLVGGAYWDATKQAVNLTGRNGKMLYFSAAGGNFNNLAGGGSRGCIRFTYIPNYNGSPLTGGNILELDTPAGNNNAIFIRHYPQSPSYILIDLRDSLGGSHPFYTSNKSFVEGQEYIFELNFDFDGVSRFYIDGVLQSSINTSSWTRVNDTGTFKWGGDNGSGDFWIKDIILFSDVQHTSNHAGELPYSYNETIYLENNVTLPEMEHTGEGTIKLFNLLSLTYLNNVRILLEIGRSGDKLYWNGSAWAVSNETYAQATDLATFNANAGSLLVDNENYGQFTLIFQAGNDQSSVSELTANMNVDTGYPTDNPTIEDATALSVIELESIIEMVTKTGSDNVKTIIALDGTYYYVNNGALAISDGSYAQSSLLSDFAGLLSSFVTSQGEVKIKRFLHSDSGATSPTITSNTIVYYETTVISINDIYEYLEGYGIDITVLSAKWIAKRIDNLIIPWIEANTRLKFDSETEYTEYLSGNGKEILTLSKKPVNELVSIRFVRSTGALTDLTNTVELDKKDGILISKNNPAEGLYWNVFEKGNKNIVVTYKYGFDDFVDSNNNEAVDIKEAILCMACKQALIQIGARTGGGSVSVQSHSRDYGQRGKYTDIINNLDAVSFEILKNYFTGVVGT